MWIYVSRDKDMYKKVIICTNFFTMEKVCQSDERGY